MSRSTRTGNDLLLGEWACLGLLHSGPSHGFAIAVRLKPGSDIGRIWSLTRPLTYRALEQLQIHGYVEESGEEAGLAGGNRTLLTMTKQGRAIFRTWINTPVVHLRDMRSELLLKLVLADECGIDISAMLKTQRKNIKTLQRNIERSLDGDSQNDTVHKWRSEIAEATLRFIDSLK
jgi:DNA-binding PadR family transcriptional regulator